MNLEEIIDIPESIATRIEKLRIGEYITIEGRVVRQSVFVEKKSMNPQKYAVMSSGMRMSRLDGVFEYEPSPSGRTADYLEECSFDSIYEAVGCFLKFHPGLNIQE